jgi:hypothetical protein
MFDEATKTEIGKIAKELGVEEAALLAIAEVESSGKAVDWNNWPLIRWEGHYFHRFLKAMPDKAKLNAAVAAGLANPSTGGVKNPKLQKDRYALLDKACAIDADSALMSCSWGLGQVMGSNWTDLGYKSVQALVDRCKESVAGQVEVMARFIKTNGLVKALQNHDWEKFTKRYNGASGITAGYHTKIGKAYKKYAGA